MPEPNAQVIWPEDGLRARIAELDAENAKLRDLVRRCMKVGCQWCGLPAVSLEVENRVMRQARAEEGRE